MNIPDPLTYDQYGVWYGFGGCGYVGGKRWLNISLGGFSGLGVAILISGTINQTLKIHC